MSRDLKSWKQCALLVVTTEFDNYHKLLALRDHVRVPKFCGKYEMCGKYEKAYIKRRVPFT